MASGSDPVERIAGLFDALAATYDSVGVDFFQPIAASLVSALGPQPGEKWLDVGCGRGAVLLKAAQAVAPHGSVTGIDISSAMVELANESATAFPHASAVLGNAMAPDADPDSFDVIASCLVLFFLPDPAAAVRAWLPLLKPEGRLGVTTFGPTDQRWEYIDDVLTPYLSPAMLDARASGRQGPFASNEGMEELVTAAGFVDARTQVATIQVRFANPEKWYEFSWSVGQRMLWLAVPEEDRPQVKRQAVERFASVADADGSVVFTQEIRHTLARRWA